MSLEILRDVLAQGNDAPDKTARSKVQVQKAIDGVLKPIESKLAEIEGPKTAFMGGHTGRTKPQFIAELRIEVPEDRSLWIPQMRIALENEKKNDAVVELGFTIAQSWTDKKRGNAYPAHIRWGAWTLAADKARKIRGPLAIMGRAVGAGIERLPERPVTNKPTGTISMLGKMRMPEELDGLSSLEELATEVAADLMLLSRALLR